MLNDFLKRHAGQQQRRGFGKTYVALCDDPPEIMGFVTVSVGQVATGTLPSPPRLPCYPVSILRIGISEARKGRKANSGVQAFWSASADLYIAVQNIGEIRRGLGKVRQRGDNDQALRLESWLDRIVRRYGDRILRFDTDCAQVWGKNVLPCSMPNW